MTVPAVVARSLADNGVSTVFGVIGNLNLFMVECLVSDHGVRYVGAAHEAGAVSMAVGFGRAGGGLGVATVTHGPALTNSLTALTEAARSRTPLIVISGTTPDLELQHSQRMDIVRAVHATGAGVATVHDHETTARVVATAVRRAHVERRPILLNVPIDLHAHAVTYEHVPARVPPLHPLAPDDDSLDKAVGIIATAKRPIVLAGRGAAGARESLLRLAERTGALLATTLLGKGLFSGEPYDIGVFGTVSTSLAAQHIAESDCIIAMGAGLNRHTTAGYSLVRGKRVVHCDVDPLALDRWFSPDVSLLGDAATTADTIVAWLDQGDLRPSTFRSTVNPSELAAFDPTDDFVDRSTEDCVDLRTAMIMIDSLLPTERTIVTDAGRFFLEAFRYLRVPDPSAMVLPVNFGAVGLGVSTAIGAAIARPDRVAVAVVGDGGFMMGGLTEFNTAVREALNLIVVVCNDGAYGAEHIQYRERNCDPFLATFKWPAFGPVAVALGGEAITARNIEELRATGPLLHDRKAPLLLDVKVDPSGPRSDGR